MSWVKFQTKLKKEVYFYLIVFCSSKLYEEHFFVEFSLYPDVIPKFLYTEILSITRPNFYQIIIKLFRVGKFGGLIRRGGVVGSVCFFFWGGGGGWVQVGMGWVQVEEVWWFHVGGV